MSTGKVAVAKGEGKTLGAGNDRAADNVAVDDRTAAGGKDEPATGSAADKKPADNKRSDKDRAASAKKLAGATGGVIAGVIVYFACGNVGLGQQGVICLALLAWAVVWWVAGILPEYVTALLMAAGFVVVAGVQTPTAFAAFSTSTWWLLVAAFGLGAAMKSSGLMHRMALAIIVKFPASFRARVAGLMAVGTVLGPLVPSLSAKTSMITPIAMSMGDAAGYPRKGRQMQGLFLAMLAGVRNIGPAVISASVIGYGLLALLPADVQQSFNMLHWFVAALPWFVVVTVLNYVAIVVLYGPRKGDAGISSAVSQDGPQAAGDASAPVDVAQAYRDLGPMSKLERRMLVIILLTVGMWVAQPLHHIDSTIVALVALVAVHACGIMDKGAFRTQISWTSLVFIGVIIGIADVFAQAGVSDWIVAVAGPLFTALAQNPYAFVVGVGLVTIVLRFVIVSEMAYVNIVMVFLVPLAIAQGINPWVVGFAVYATVNPWFVLYQNPIYLAAFYSVDGQMVRHVDMAKYCALYMLICLVGLAASVPYWQWMGLFG